MTPTTPARPKLTAAQLDILRHTARQRPRQVFCGDGPDMQALVAAGLMRSLGKVSWCPDEYFALTDAGRAALAAEGKR